MQRVTVQRVTVSATGHSECNGSQCNGRVPFFAQWRTPSYCESQCNGQHLRLIKNAVILRVSVQRATPLLHEERRHIAGLSATGSFIMQKCVYNIYRVERSIRFLSHRKQCITHKDSVRHNTHLHFWRCGPASFEYKETSN